MEVGKDCTSNLTQTRNLQRKGDSIGYARVSAEADSLLKQLETAQSNGEIGAPEVVVDTLHGAINV
jgi:hypothetical protein